MSSMSPLSIVLLLALSCILILPTSLLTKEVDAICAPNAVGDFSDEISGNNVYILWESDLPNNGTGTSYLFLRASHDGGKTFGNAIVVYTTEGERCSLYPHLAVGSGGGGNGGKSSLDNVYVMWEDSGKILFRASSDGGSSFGNIITLGHGTLGEVGMPSLILNGGQILGNGTSVYAIWNAYSGEQHTKLANNYRVTERYDILFRKSTDGGRTFGNMVNLTGSEDSSYSLNPKIAVSGDNTTLYAVWSEDTDCFFTMSQNHPPECSSKVMFAKSVDGGTTFSSAADISGNRISNTASSWTGTMPADPAIRTQGNNVYVTWLNEWNSTDPFFTKSNDSGRTFSAPIDLVKEYSLQGVRLTSYPARFAFSNNILYLAWEMADNTYANHYPYIIKSIDGGNTFHRVAEQTIPEGVGNSYNNFNGEMSVTGAGRLYFTWPESNNGTIMFEAVQENQSASSGVKLLISEGRNDTSLAQGPVVVTPKDSNNLNLNIVWLETVNQQPRIQSYPDQIILVRSSTDSGKTFYETIKIVDTQSLPEFSSSSTGLIMAIAIVGVINAGILVRRRFSYHDR